MKTFLLLLVGIILCFSYSQAQLQGPESVLFNDTTGTWLISCAQGGKIVSMTPGGGVEDFTSGLTSPKGMCFGSNSIWVTDVNKLVQLDVFTGKIIKHHPISGAQMLNDVAWDEIGSVFVSDMNAGIIYRLYEIDGSYEVFADEGVVKPNGLSYNSFEMKLIFVSWGSNGSIYSIEDWGLEAVVQEEFKTQFDNLDGITFDENRYQFYFSSWGESSVFSIDAFFMNEPQLLIDNIDGPADIYFDKFSDTLAIPAMNQNEVIFLNLGESSIEERNTTAENIKVYPNPVNDVINIQAENMIGKYVYRIIDLQGRPISAGTVFFDDNKTQIDFSQCNSGVYFIALRNTNSVKHLIITKK